MRPLTMPLPWNDIWALASFHMDREEGARRWGPPHMEEPADIGGEALDTWAFGSECGLQVVLSFRKHSGFWQVEGNLPEPEHALLHLEIPGECVNWRGERIRARRTRNETEPESWTVLRQDDYGNRFPMDVLATERTARCLADIYEARAHKQSYWVERKR
jgi:hypothetical protein